MNPAGRDTSVAPGPIAALSCSNVTDKSWSFAGKQFLSFTLEIASLRPQ
jgi:hypothetical protein